MKTNQVKQNSKADYGQDMPGVVIIASILSFVLLGLAYWQYSLYGSSQIDRNHTISIILLSVGIFLLFIAAVGIWSSRHGKLILRNNVLNGLTFKGPEIILDLGCGNGLLLLGAAKKLPQGKAIGADHWVSTLEYKYTPAIVQKNAKIEGVSERVEIVTADAQSLPFADSSFDMVMTSLMMHHVHDKQKAFSEMFRVLKPDGSLVIANVMAKRYIPLIKSLGFNQIEVRYATRLFLIPAFIVKVIKS